MSDMFTTLTQLLTALPLAGRLVKSYNSRRELILVKADIPSIPPSPKLTLYNM